MYFHYRTKSTRWFRSTWTYVYVLFKRFITMARLKSWYFKRKISKNWWYKTSHTYWSFMWWLSWCVIDFRYYYFNKNNWVHYYFQRKWLSIYVMLDGWISLKLQIMNIYEHYSKIYLKKKVMLMIQNLIGREKQWYVFFFIIKLHIVHFFFMIIINIYTIFIN